MDLWVREARLFKYGCGTGLQLLHLRGENEPLSGGGKSSGLMSFLKIGDRAAGAIKSGGTTRRAAKMVCLDLDHPDIETFVNWKVREELKVAPWPRASSACRRSHPARQSGSSSTTTSTARRTHTVCGPELQQLGPHPQRFFHARLEDGDWELTRPHRRQGRKTLKARDLWEQIAYAAWRCADPGVQYDDTINEWHTCPESGAINASNPCVTGDTRVATPGRHLAADRPDDPPARGVHQPRRPGDPRHRGARSPPAPKDGLRAAHPGGSRSSSPPTTRSGPPSAAGSMAKDLHHDARRVKRAAGRAARRRAAGSQVCLWTSR